LQRLGVRLEVTEAVLNHISGSRGRIAGVYQRHDWAAEKRAALDAWAAHVLAIGEQRKPADNVVKLGVAGLTASGAMEGRQGVAAGFPGGRHWSQAVAQSGFCPPYAPSDSVALFCPIRGNGEETTMAGRNLRTAMRGTAASTLLFALFASDAFAESPTPAVALPACYQSMIAGTWQALFENVFLGYTMACTISVSSTGAISNSVCSIGGALRPGDANWTLTQPPSGALTINHACHVVGSINYIVCASQPCSNPNQLKNIQTLPSLWRSRDGSRLSGLDQWTDDSYFVAHFFRLELIG
jgi:hypothetical protein